MLVVVALGVVSRPDRTLEDAGVYAFVGLIALITLWILPWPLLGSRTVRLDGFVLATETMRGPRHVDLQRLRKVWARRVPSRRSITVLGVADDSQRVWLVNPDVDAARILAQVAHVASGPGVEVTPLARGVLSLPGAPRWRTRLRLWAQTWVVFIGVAIAGTYVAAAYASWAWGR